MIIMWDVCWVLISSHEIDFKATHEAIITANWSPELVIYILVSQYSVQLEVDLFLPKSGKNRRLVTDEPVEFE